MSAQTLGSWGGVPAYPQHSVPAYWRGGVAADFAAAVRAHGTTLAYGNGRSYGDSCLAASDHVLHMRPLNRFIAADWQAGIIVAEAGMTHEEVLALAVPRGWFMPVTPGTRFVTLGGSVANDVHGKNHHVRGTFGMHVRRFGLLRSDMSPGSPPLCCSPQENTEYFAATIGGLGLTGVITWVELQLMPIRSTSLAVTTARFAGLAEFFSLSRECDAANEYTVAWVDCLASGRAAGRGVFMAANHSVQGSLRVPALRKISMPFAPPVSLVNQVSLRLFNSLYYHAHPQGRRQSVTEYEPFFYPLDRILHWNRIYGRKGFQQYQCVVPMASAESATADLLREIAASGKGSFLAVLKRCGDARSPGLLSFPMSGVSLALDFAEEPTLAQHLFPRLDAIVRVAGGRLYPAKDAHMSGADFRAFYPAWERLAALRDTGLSSRFWDRVCA